MVIDIFLILLIAVQAYLGYVERKDLNDRLMAKSLSELKDVKAKDEQNLLPAGGDEIPLEDAQEDIENG